MKKKSKLKSFRGELTYLDKAIIMQLFHVYKETKCKFFEPRVQFEGRPLSCVTSKVFRETNRYTRHNVLFPILIFDLETC